MEQAPFSPLLFELAQLLSLLSEYDGELGPAASASILGTPLQAEKLQRIGSKELAENVADQVLMARCDTLQHAARLWKDKAIALERALADLQTQVDAGTALPRGKAPHDTVSPSRLTVRAHDAAVAGERSPARGGLLHTALSHPASEEVLINALAAIFVTVDADSSNMVTAFELRAFVSRDVGLGQGLGEQLCRLLAADGDLEAAMGAHDANKDGVMSVDEFVSMAVATLRSAEGSELQPTSTSELPTGETKHAIKLKSEAPESKDDESRMILPVSLLVSSTASGAFVRPPKEKTSAGFSPPLSSCTLPHEMEQSSAGVPRLLVQAAATESSITVESLKSLVGEQQGVVAGRGGGSNEDLRTSDTHRKVSREEGNIATVAGMQNDEGSIHASAATMPGVAVAQEGNSAENGVGRDDEGTGTHGGHGMSRQEEVRHELVRLYTEFNPQNMENIDKLLDLYEGRETQLFERLYRKYHIVGQPPFFGKDTKPVALLATLGGRVGGSLDLRGWGAMPPPGLAAASATAVAATAAAMVENNRTKIGVGGGDVHALIKDAMSMRTIDDAAVDQLRAARLSVDACHTELETAKSLLVIRERAASAFFERPDVLAAGIGSEDELRAKDASFPWLPIEYEAIEVKQARDAVTEVYDAASSAEADAVALVRRVSSGQLAIAGIRDQSDRAVLAIFGNGSHTHTDEDEDADGGGYPEEEEDSGDHRETGGAATIRRNSGLMWLAAEGIDMAAGEGGSGGMDDVDRDGSDDHSLDSTAVRETTPALVALRCTLCQAEVPLEFLDEHMANCR